MSFLNPYFISTKGAQTYGMGLHCFCVCCWIPITALRNIPPYPDMHFNALIITLDYTNPYIVTHYNTLITTLHKQVHCSKLQNEIHCIPLYGSHRDRLKDWAALSDLITVQWSEVRWCDIHQSEVVWYTSENRSVIYSRIKLCIIQHSATL